MKQRIQYVVIWLVLAALMAVIAYCALSAGLASMAGTP